VVSARHVVDHGRVFFDSGKAHVRPLTDATKGCRTRRGAVTPDSRGAMPWQPAPPARWCSGSVSPARTTPRPSPRWSTTTDDDAWLHPQRPSSRRLSGSRWSRPGTRATARPARTRSARRRPLVRRYHPSYPEGCRSTRASLRGQDHQGIFSGPEAYACFLAFTHPSFAFSGPQCAESGARSPKSCLANKNCDSQRVS